MTADDRWTRRDFLSVGALGVLGLATGQQRPASADDQFAYIGTYTDDGRSKGIYRLFLNATSGAMRVDGLAAESRNPSFLALHPNGRTLYAVNEVHDHGGKPMGAVTAFAIARESGALTLLNQLPSHGKDPCYVSVDRTGRTVLVANYTSGSIASFTVRQSGRLGVARTIYLAFDQDAPGQEAAYVLARRLGTRLRPVSLPEGVKDVSELGLHQEGEAQFHGCLQRASQQTAQLQRPGQAGLARPEAA